MKTTVERRHWNNKKDEDIVQNNTTMTLTIKMKNRHQNKITALVAEDKTPCH